MQSINWKTTALSCCFVLASCSSSDNTPGGNPSTENPNPIATVGPFEGLRVIGDRDKFQTSVREALINTLSSGEAELNTLPVATPSVASPDSASAPEATDSNGASATVDANTNPTSLLVTETNVQEAGVDESDRIKSDGKHLYVLNGLADVEILPVTDPGVETPDDGAAVLLPRTSVPYEPYGTAEIRVLSLDSDSADAQLVQTIEFETSGLRPDGMYMHQTDSSSSLFVTGSSMGDYWADWDASVQFYGQRSAIQKIDIADPGKARRVDALSIDGQIVSSRRVGDYLYVASRYFPWMDGDEPFGNSPEAVEETINNTPIEQLLPQVTRQSDGATQPLADASRCFVTERPASGYYAPDIITLSVIDLNAVIVTDSVCYLGSTETLYASPRAVYLATTQVLRYTEVGDVAAPDLAPDPVSVSNTSTAIHQFAIDGSKLNYVGSGKVLGHLGWDAARRPYRMGEKDGNLRVVTVNDESIDGPVAPGLTSPVTLSVLKPVGNGRLDVIGRLPNSNRPGHIGKPGEQLYASRFLGDKAYLVTFRQTDPLYVVNLTDPTDPFVAGELEIPGFSDYLAPLDNNHLLGIGRGAIAATSPDLGERGAFAQGVKVSLFDVSDPARPREVNSIEIGKRGTHSNALYDPHAITFQRGAPGEATRLAIGIDVNDVPNAYSQGPSGWHEWRETGLFGFEIRTDANAGITQHGKMIVEARGPANPYGPIRFDDRSVIVNDAIFYVHGELVYGANWHALGNPSGPR